MGWGGVGVYPQPLGHVNCETFACVCVLRVVVHICMCREPTTFNYWSHVQTVLKLVLVENLWWCLLCRKFVLHTMSYRKQYRKHLRAPPTTPPDLDPQAREPADSTIDDLLEHPRARRLYVPSQPVASPNWDLVPMLPGRVRRIVYEYCWGPPNGASCSMHLTEGGGRRGWRYPEYHANKSILKIRPDKIGAHPMTRSSLDVDDDGDNDSPGSFVGTDDGFDDRTPLKLVRFEDHTPKSCYANPMHVRKHIGVRRIVNATILRVEPRPSSFSQGLNRWS